MLFSYGESLVPVPNLDIQISDGSEQNIIQRYNIAVAAVPGANQVPQYIGPPLTTAVVDYEYNYQVNRQKHSIKR